MFSNEIGSRSIVKYLNNNHYLSPIGYRKTGNIQNKNENQYKWNEVTICNMLKNEVYIGNTVQNKKTSISYKVKKRKTVQKEEQIKVENTHEAIIDKNTFEKVKIIIKKRSSNAKIKYNYLLRDLLYCHHCKRKLQIVLKKNSKSKAKPHPYITCSNYNKNGCYSLNISYEKFEKHIIYLIKNIIKENANKNILNIEYEKKLKKDFETEENNKIEIEKIENKINELNNKLEKMYEDKLKGILLEEDYIRHARKNYR